MYRVATMLVCASIVVTAVYILRACGGVDHGVAAGGRNVYCLSRCVAGERESSHGLLIIGIVAIGVWRHFEATAVLINQ